MTQQVIATFKPLPWQIAPWRDKSEVLLLEGPSGSGKTRVAAEKIHGLMMHYPGAVSVAGRKDKTAAVKSVVPMLYQTVMGGDGAWGRYRANLQMFDYKNGSRIWLVGFNDAKQREALRSIGKDGGFDFGWIEEANKTVEEDFNELMARMRGTTAGWNQLMYTTNPDNPMNYINKRLIIGGEAARYTATYKDNPYLPPEYGERLNRLTGVQRSRLFLGLWAWSEGVVYDNFSTDDWPDGNLCDDEPDPNMPIELAVDDGYVDPRATLFIQKRGKEILVFDEMYHSGHLEETCVGEVVERSQLWPWGEKKPDKGINRLPDIAVISHEANQLERRFTAADIPARRKSTKIVDGINKVRGLICDGDGQRTLKVNRRCAKLIEEITAGYKYPDSNAKRNNENPEDKNNHAVDALRMWVMMRA